jgi:hypothetical protein
MERKTIIILAIILFILIILNHVSLVVTPSSNKEEQNISNQFGYMQTPKTCSNLPGCCSLTQFGCCPDGINSRVNTLGSNCPITYSQGYNPNMVTQPPPVPVQANIIKPLPPRV